MKTRLLLAFLCLSGLTLLPGCKKDEVASGGINNNSSQEELPLIEQPIVVAFPEEVSAETLQELRVSTVYGESKLEPHSLRNTGTVGLTQYSAFKHLNKGLMLVQLVDKQNNMLMCTLQNPEAKIKSIDIEETAIALLMLTPPLITDNIDTYARTKAQLKALPEYKEFLQQVKAEYLKGEREKRSPSYSNIKTGPVLIALMRKSFENYQVEQSGLSIKEVKNLSGGKISFTVQNDRKRATHIYGRQIWMDYGNNAHKKFVVKDEKDLPLWYILNSESASYWGIVKGSIAGDQSSIYKSTSSPITVDIADADKLFVDVYGAGKLDKPFSSLKPEEQLRYLMVWMHTAYNDVLVPFINLVYGTQKLSDASGSDNFKYDLRYGSKKDPVVNLISDLGTAFLSDEEQVEALVDNLRDGEFMAIAYQVGEFCLDQIVGNKQSPEVKRRHLNNLYNAYKKYSGISRTEDSFRAGLKKLANQLSHAKNANFASKVIKLSELTLDLSGTIYAILESEGKSTFIIDKKGNLDEAQKQEEGNEQTELPEGVLIDTNGTLLKWPNTAIPQDGVVRIPNTVKVIGMEAFGECINLKQVILHNRVSSIERRAFHSTSLTSINLPNSIRRIGDEAFSNCSVLKEVTLPSSTLSEIANGLFAGCTSLSKINLPQGLKSIGRSAFSQCTNLRDINIPEGVTKIGGNAFAYVQGSITLPSTVTDLGVGESSIFTWPFFTSEDITIGRTVYLKAVTPPSIYKGYINNYTQKSILGTIKILYVPRGSKQKYLEAEIYGLDSNNVEEYDFD